MKYTILAAILCVLVFAGATFANENAGVDESDVIVLNGKTHNGVQKGIWLVEYYAPWCGFCKRLTPVWAQLATEVKTKNLGFKVAKINCDDAANKETCLSNDAHGYPTIHLWINGKKSTYRSERTIEALLNFVNEEKAKLSAAELKTAEEGFKNPETAPAPAGEASGDDESAVVVLTTENFHSTVAKGWWLVEFYAPWCGHCKRLAPTYESLAEKYAPVKDKLVIAKMDATENDIPPSAPFRVNGFPTIKFKPAGGREFIDYEGDRSIESFEEFIEKNAKNKIVLPATTETAHASEASQTSESTATPEAEKHAQQHVEL